MKNVNYVLLLQLAFTAFYGASFSALLRRADIWLPFTPTFTATPGKWVGWQDVLRWILAGFFLLFLPALFLIYVLLAFSQQPQALQLNLLPPSLSDIFKFAVVLSLVLPQLGFYDVWQAIVKSFPRVFYSEGAIKKIEEHYPNAFQSGHGTVVAWGLGWIFVPTFLFITLLWLGSK
jgi:hypothetical protein